MLWQPPDAATRGLAGFLRVGGAPGDRNLLSLEVDAGLTYKGLLPGRELDLTGVAASYGRIGSAARNVAGDAVPFGVAQPARDYQTVLELTYLLNVAPWWVLQPDMQLIFHPGGHTAAPFPAPVGQPIPNASGPRSSIHHHFLSYCQSPVRRPLLVARPNFSFL